MILSKFMKQESAHRLECQLGLHFLCSVESRKAFGEWKMNHQVLQDIWTGDHLNSAASIGHLERLQDAFVARSTVK